MANLCETCPQNCCVHFKLTRELFDPQSVKENLRTFPFIRKVGSKIEIAPGGHEASVGIYSCDRFNQTTGICANYESQPRPDYCLQTGNKFYPHKNCLLKTK